MVQLAAPLIVWYFAWKAVGWLTEAVWLLREDLWALTKWIGRTVRFALKASVGAGVLYLLWEALPFIPDVILPFVAMLAVGTLLYGAIRVGTVKYETRVPL